MLRTPGPHEDFGNVARAIGSISAVGRGFDAIAYLDADNWYAANHIELLWRTQQETGAEVCSAASTICDRDGKVMGHCTEVDGDVFADTSCLFLTRKAFPFLASWYLMPSEQGSFGDRVMWEAIRRSSTTRTHQPIATVNYRTNYRTHYEQFGIKPPPGIKEKVEVPIEIAARPMHLARGDAPGSASAAKRERISLCLIVRDEEKNLADCLRPVAKLVDEIVVIDCLRPTGRGPWPSSLRRVFDYEWKDSFAAARNEWFRHATGDWILWLDADERFDEANLLLLQQLLGRLADYNVVYLMKQSSAPNDAAHAGMVVDHARLFRRQQGLAWRYRVHEQILSPLQELQSAGRADRNRHHPYRLSRAGADVEEAGTKSTAFGVDLADRPDDPFVLLNLAKAAALMDAMTTRCGMPGAASRQPRRTASFVPKAYSLLAETYRAELGDLSGRGPFAEKEPRSIPTIWNSSTRKGCLVFSAATSTTLDSASSVYWPRRRN